MSLDDWIAVGSIALAVVALVRPELGLLFRRWTNDLEYHPAGLCEIGFSALGPTVSVAGTIWAVHNDQFVREISATVRRRRDGASFDFSWVIFKAMESSINLATQQEQQVKLDIAAPFLAETESGKSVNILFHDKGTLEAVKQQLLSLKAKWDEFASSQEAAVFVSGLTEPRGSAEFNAKVLGRFQELYAADFSSGVDAMEREFYWREGEYDVSVEVLTSRPEKRYGYAFSFTLSESDSERLRRNVYVAIMEMTALSPVTYSFAYSQYAGFRRV